MPLPSIAGDIPLDMAGSTGGQTPAAAPPLGFFDKVRLGYKEAGAAADWGWNQHQYEAGAYQDIRSELEQKGYKLPDRGFAMFSPQSEDEADFYAVGYHPGKPWLAGFGAQQRFDAFWNAFNDARSKDPAFASAYKDVHDFGSLLDHVKAKRLGDAGDVATQAPDGLGLGGFIGQLGHGATDPLSWLPIAGPETGEAASFASRLLAGTLQGAAINAGVTAATEPLVRRDAANLGQDRTLGDFVDNLMSSTALGGAFGMVGAGIHVGRDAVVDAFQRRRAEAAPPPEGQTATTPPPSASPLDSFDAKVAKTFAEVVPEEQRTPDEQAALHAVNRAVEVKATSPFVEGPAGDDAHAQALDRGMHIVNGGASNARPGGVKPIARENIQTPADVEGARMPARELVKAKIHSVEGPHGGANLEGSKALGPYQFMPQTWVSLFKRRYPGDTRSFDQIAALREDPHLNDVLMNDLISENAAALRHAGFDETAGNLYLAHVLGHDRAVTVLRANPETTLGELLPHNYFGKNPFKPTDNAASLVHWAYRKMGDDGSIPAHVAATPDVEAGSQGISEAERLPEIEQPSPGQNDVEALYADVGATDRPVLKPELFDSPEAHAAAQLRFERESDAADGFAPVMSRAEAFAPSEHFDALRRYKGTVTADAIGEALGLSPGEVRRAVGSMQATDPNSPFVLSRGRQPKFDAEGNVVKPGTEAGRIIRRPPKPGTNRVETMLEYLTRTNGGLADTGGDIASMGGHDWHKGAPFRRKLIDNEHGQPLDDAFQRAIDAGYFPEHQADAETYDDLPDIQDFHDAIDAELRGRPRYAAHDYAAAEDAARRLRYGDEQDHEPMPESAADRAQRLFELTGHNQEAIAEAAQERGIVLHDDQMIIDASDLMDAGMSQHDALDSAIAMQALRDGEIYAAESGDLGYELGNGFEGDTAEPRDGEPAYREDEPGGGRPAAEPGVAEASRVELAQLAHDPKAAKFGDPVGVAAEAQADSVIHDLQMQPDEGGSYRLDEEGGEQSVQSLLDNVDEEQRAADEMRNCLKPKGGEE